jgi:hypothetical protein
MHNKKTNNNKSQNFIQGLRPLSSSIPHGLKKIFKKSGYNFSNVVDNWTKMVGKEISNACYPSTIKTSKNMDNGILVLNVMHGKELIVEYGKKEIIDQINSFFGYNYISEIKLKIVQVAKTERKQTIISKKENKILKQSLETIKNSELKSSLDKLINAFNKKNDKKII